MEDQIPTQTAVRFGPFELFVETGELRKDGTRLKLSGQPIQVLIRLVATPGKLVTREELQHELWAGNNYGDFDKGLNAAVNRLREYLGDSATEPRYIETIPGRGYRFIADLATGLSNLPAPEVEPPKARHRWLWIAGVVAAIATTDGTYVWWKSPPAVPVVESVSQLTDDGRHPKLGTLVSDGSRIYFNEGSAGNKKIIQVSTAGGETSEIRTRLADPETVAIAPDGSSLLVGDGAGDLSPFWLVPLPTGEPRRLGTIMAQEGGFFPDGRVVFAQNTDLFMAEKDGSNVRKLLAVGEYVTCPRVSPDGTRIIFLVVSKRGSNILAEVSADGSRYHEVMRGTSDVPVFCGYWAPDGNYVVTRRSWDIWAIPVRTGVLAKRYKPVQLTNGPLRYWNLSPSSDGRHIFAIGLKLRGELVRYDKQSSQFVPSPVLSGISARAPYFSQDGQWVVYLSYADRILWRSRPDGTDRMQLTYPPTQVEFSVISPDGKKVGFQSTKKAIVVMNIDGTSKREIQRKDARLSDWSPDGNSLVLVVPIEGKRMGEESSQQLETIDLQSGKSSVVPSSQGLYAVASNWVRYAAAWVASDTLIAATLMSPTDDQKSWQKLVTLDLQSGKRTELVSGPIVWWLPSPDRKYIYYRTGGAEPKCMRIRLSDRKLEEVASLKDLRQPVDATFSVAPDGSPIFSRDVGTQEIYSIAVKWP